MRSRSSEKSKDLHTQSTKYSLYFLLTLVQLKVHEESFDGGTSQRKLGLLIHPSYKCKIVALIVLCRLSQCLGRSDIFNLALHDTISSLALHNTFSTLGYTTSFSATHFHHGATLPSAKHKHPLALP